MEKKDKEKSFQSVGINWYPGHMSKAKRQMQDDLKLIDVIIELVDARIPFSSKNPDIDKMAGNKPRVLLLNKADMADPTVTDRWCAYYDGKGYYTVKINSRNGNGVNKVKDAVLSACSKKIERDRSRGILNRPLRAMVCGIPNVGKSTFINSLAGKACTKTGNKPGVTKGKQWIKLAKNIELMDTPGILWPKFEDESIGKKIAYIGSINDNILVTTEMASDLLEFLTKNYEKETSEYYGISLTGDKYEDLKAIAFKRGCLKKGGEPDFERAARLITDDFRNVRIGKISLEKPEEFGL